MHYFAKGLLGLVILTPIVGYTMGYWWGFGVAIMCILAMTGMFERKKDMEKKNEDLAKRIAQNIGKNATKQNNSQLTEYPGQTRQMKDPATQQEPVAEDQANIRTVADDIEKLGELMEKGFLTQTEFDEEKQRVLNQ